jgi:putative methylase
MDGHAQKRLIRKLDLELFLADLTAQPNPQCKLEQYTSSAQIAANMLYLAAYSYGDIEGKAVLDLGCGTGRLALGAAFLGAKEVVGVDVDRQAIETAKANAEKAGLSDKIQWVLGDIGAVTGQFDTVLENPPFGVQTREADRAFLVKALEAARRVYSLHSHPEVDQRLIRILKSSPYIAVQPNAFLDRFIAKHSGAVESVYAMLMTIPKMFEFHSKAKHDFAIDLYVIRKQHANPT